ncbi:UNKNOWN [Stylonychia lemnae]|uniref:Uncharacterized protein n=1 Tax=Stylonychia lemnae TaxID=5949 RepID=A0A078BAJ0_STYLE|nr:UNKNOWN [Stylonychia lemnae]|eukprot:CDW90583.1 UNKNOWN [Stylonychia lemnae]
MFATHNTFNKTISSDLIGNNSGNRPLMTSKFQNNKNSSPIKMNMSGYGLDNSPDRQTSQSFFSKNDIAHSHNIKIRPRILRSINNRTQEPITNSNLAPISQDSLTPQQAKQEEVKAYHDTRLKFKNYLQSFSVQNAQKLQSSSINRIKGEFLKNQLNQMKKHEQTKFLKGILKKQTRLAKDLKHVKMDNYSLGSDTEISITSSESQYSSDRDKVPSELEFDQMPFHYQYNINDSDFLKEKKFQLRLRDLYKMLSKNQVVVLPDPQIRSRDAQPMFQIFTADFRERKKYQKFKNAYMAGDVKKETSEFMADIIKPQITKIMQQNKNMGQSDSIKFEKIRLKSLIKKQKELQLRKKEEDKEKLDKIKVDPIKVKQEYTQNFLKMRREMKQQKLNQSQLSAGKQAEKSKDAEIKNKLEQSGGSSERKKQKYSKIDTVDSTTILEKQDPFVDGKRNSKAQNMDQFFSQYTRRSTVVYQPSLMLQAFMIHDGQEDNDRFLKVKQEWIDMKRKLENKISTNNKKYESIEQILSLTKDRDQASPIYRSSLIKQKFAKIQEKKESRASQIRNLLIKHSTIGGGIRNKSQVIHKMNTYQAFNMNVNSQERRATLSDVFFEKKDRDKKSVKNKKSARKNIYN